MFTSQFSQVLDNVEYLDNLGDRCINFFAALQELTLIYTLTVIFISRVIPEKFDITPAVILHFPQYNKGEVWNGAPIDF